MNFWTPGGAFDQCLSREYPHGRAVIKRNPLYKIKNPIYDIICQIIFKNYRGGGAL